MLPPAPARLSATTCTPHTSVRRCAARRPRMSVGPPGGNGTMKRTGFDGYCCATVGIVTTLVAPNTTNKLSLEVVFIQPPRLLVSALRNWLEADERAVTRWRRIL